MLFLNKLIKGIKDDPTIFKNPKIGFILGLTKSQITNLKKFAIENEYIIQSKQNYSLTNKGELLLRNNPIKSWRCDKYPKRPDLNLEYLKEEKTPATVTKAIRNLARHLLDGESLKENSMEEFIQEELLNKNSKFRGLIEEIENYLSQNKRINLGEIFNIFSNYGLTKSIINILLLDVLARNKDTLAIYEKYQFTLIINQLLFDKIMFAPQNFELQKTVFNETSVLTDISDLILPHKSENILEITKGLVYFIRGLDKYTLQTQQLSKTAIKLRNAVINAKDPINLLTIDIPRIIQGRKLKDCDKQFVITFEKTLSKLQFASENMIKSIKQFTLDSFNSADRQELTDRFKKVEEFIGAKELKTLYSNVTNTDVSDNYWIERIATYINKSRVPKDWTDEDVADYKVKIKELSLKFYVLEATVGSSSNTITANFHSVLADFLKLSKPEQFIMLRKVVNN